MARLKKNGSAPNSETVSHTSPTVTSPSRAKISLRFTRSSASGTPSAARSSTVSAKPNTAARSPQQSEMTSAGSINAASTQSTFPRMLKIMR